MARKRMISPEIWDSQSFGKLSILSKLIWIGLISLADDEGRGLLSPQLIKSKVLPYDEKTRVTDVQQSITEICAVMSITKYEVEGKPYYYLNNWREWQYIQKPNPSKIPNPPTGGEGEELHKTEEVRYKYDTSTVQVSPQIEEEIEKEYEERDACARSPLLKKLPDWIVVDTTEVPQLDYAELIKHIERSHYLKEWRFLSKYIAKADKILQGYYDDYKDDKKAEDSVVLADKGRSKDAVGYMQHEYTEEQLNKAFINYK